MQTKYDGKVYTLMQLGPNMVKHVDPEYTAEKYEDLMYVTSTRASFYVRDDILKKIHPEAHTVKELQEIYMKNGEFTDAEMTDFTVKSLDEFRKLLEDIAALNITEGDKKVWPIYTADGTDNWGLFAELLSFTGAGYGSPNSYFAYYDKATQKLANPFKQDWFKDFAKFWTDICQDGLASKEALIDTRAAFEQKVNNGEYAILYGTTVPPTDEVLQAGGKPYAYRKVFIDIPMDTERFVNISSENIFTNYGLCFFKDVMSEAELEQVLRLIDFSYTEAGMKFSAWGPKKSGLYAEDEKGFYYTDEAFEKAMISGGDNQVFFDYGYASFPVMTHFMGDVDKRNNNNYFNLYAPQIEYTKRDNERVPSEYSNAMNYAYIEPKPDNLVYLAKPWHIWLFTGEIEGVKTMWNARTAVEDAIKKVLTAQNDEEFEAFYAEVIELQEGYGYDDACFDEMTQWLEDKNGKEAMDALRNFQ